MELSYDKLIGFLGGIPKSDFFKDPKVVKEFNENIGKFKIEPKLLDLLKEEQNKLKKIRKNDLTIASKENNEFKYTIKRKGQYEDLYLIN